MHAPAFWWAAKPTALAQILRPIGVLYGTITAYRMKARGAVPRVPVICVGNFTVGGAGKTPTALALAELLKSRGETVYFLSRGHGGHRPRGTEPMLVEPFRHTASVVGDEPLLLARVAPTIVSRDRLSGAQAASDRGASVIIMDDGMQNPAVSKHWVLAVVDGQTGIGNGLCFPAGPLRAPIDVQMRFANALVLIGEIGAGRGVGALAQTCSRPVIKARLVADPQVVASLKGRRLYAFAGIGAPQKFFRMLDQCGAVLVGTRSFSDHHHFTSLECQQLGAAAAQAQAHLVTTEKDLMRLPKDFPAIALPVSLVFANSRQIIGLLAQALPYPR